jgi:hypothetical protein
LTPKEFEQQIAKIQFVLEGQNANVQWDAKIPDPDNPDQRRQIDVLIERDGLRTLVECRHRSSPQDVTWIEELVGRKLSLRANSVIAVSSSGFTEGAWRKAQSLGVILRDFGSLTPEEIAAWGKGTQVFLEYLRIGRIELNLVVPLSVVRPVARSKEIFRTGKGDPWPVEFLFKEFAGQLRSFKQAKGGARLQVFTKDLYVGGLKIEEIIIRGEFERMEIPLLLPTVQVYGRLEEEPLKKMVSIEKVANTNFEIFRAPDGAFLVVDLSVVEPLKNAFFQSVLLHNRDGVPVRGVGLVGEVKPHLDLLPFRMRTIRRNSRLYASLLRSAEDPLIILPGL